MKKPQPRKLKQVRRKTTIKKYKLGKHGKTISILIKNNKTRKIIQNAQRELKNVPIHDVKNALIKNNLLKLGSTAPSNVLRTMFEESNMTGDVVNTGGDTFMHNYMNETNETRKF
jgi:ribosomal protein S17